MITATVDHQESTCKYERCKGGQHFHLFHEIDKYAV